MGGRVAHEVVVVVLARAGPSRGTRAESSMMPSSALRDDPEQLAKLVGIVEAMPAR